jgi:hypothetical protein
MKFQGTSNMKNFILLLLLALASVALGQTEREVQTGILNLKQQGSAPSAPASGKYKLYARDGKLRYKGSDNSEKLVGSGAGGAQNILISGDFEDGVSAWTLTSGTKAEETSTIVQGDKSAKLTLSAQALEFYQDSTSFASNFGGHVQGIVYVRVKTSISGLKVCSRNAGSTSTSLCVDVANSDTWGLYKIPVVLGTTSNGISIHSNGSSVTGDVYVDDALVGAVSILDSQPVISAVKAWTPTGSMNTNTTYAGKYWTVGNWLWMDVKITFAGAPNSTTLTVNLPSGFTIDTNALADASSTNNGTLGWGSFYDTSASIPYIATIQYENTTSIRVKSVRYTSSAVDAAGSQSQATPVTVAAGDSISFTARVPVTELNTAYTYVAGRANYQAYNIFQSGSALSDQTGDIAFNFGGSYTANAYGSTDMFTFSNVSSVTRVTALQPIRVSAGFGFYTAGISNARLGKNGSLIIEGPNGQSAIPVEVMGHIDLNTGDYLTFNAGGAGVRNTAEYTYATVSAVPLSQLITGTFKDIPVALGTSRWKQCFMQFGGASEPSTCTGSPCTEYYDSCGAFSTATRSAAGTYSTSATAGTFASNGRIF